MSDENRVPFDEVLTFALSDGAGGHVPFARALDGLSGEDAVRRPVGSPHSVAEVLAHMVFWQQRHIRMIDGEKPQRVEHASDGWPSVSANEWPELVRRFLEGLERYKRLGADGVSVVRPLVEGRDRTVGQSVLSYYMHDVHHLGQVILLRRMVGAWPPAGGGDTW